MSTAAAPTKPPADDRFGPYVLGEAVRRHGLFVTYAARHTLLKRAAWVVTTSPTVGLREEVAARLERQAEIVARFGHDAVLGVLEVLRDGDRVGIVMQAPDGPSLRDLLDALAPEALRPGEALAVGYEAARAAARLHEGGVAHLAIAPENLFVTREGHVKLGAMLHAAAVDEPASASDVPEPGPEAPYRSPEKIGGEAPRLASDVFSLGVVVHELATGRHPFAAEGAESSIARRIRTAEPPALDVRAAPGLDRVVARALEKLPALRYENAARLADDLEGLFEEGVTPARVVRSALARAGLLDAPTESDRTAPPVVRALGYKLGGVCAAMLLVMIGLSGSGPLRAPAKGGGAPRVGHVKVLAHPWAEVEIDGEILDTTPVGKPFPLPPGKHEVVLRHPKAPEERRAVEVVAGETVVVDVVMGVERIPDAGVDTSP